MAVPEIGAEPPAATVRPDLVSEIYAHLVERGLARPPTHGRGAGDLSPWELHVLKCIADGESTKETATRLQLSTKTVETHCRNVMNKVGIRRVALLVKYAVREGITTLDG